MTYLIISEYEENGELVSEVGQTGLPANAISSIEDFRNCKNIKLRVVLKIIYDEYNVIFIGRR